MKLFRNYSKWIVAFIFCVAVIAVYKTFDNIGNIGRGIGAIIKALSPFFGGFVIAYLLNLPSKKLTGLLKKVKLNFIKNHAYGISILVIYLAAILILTFTVKSLVPALYKNILELSMNLPEYVQDVIDWLSNLEIVKRFHLINPSEMSATQTISSFINKIDPESLSKYAQGVFNMTTGVFSAFIAFISSVYMLLDKERIIGSLVNLVNIFFSKEKADSICDHARRINYIFTSYIYCRLICSIIMALACTIVLSLMHVKYAVVLGIFIGAMDMIPYFGSIISVIIAEIVILITGGIWQTIWTSIVLLIMQQIDGNLLAPKIMGMSLDMRPLWIVVVITVGGSFFGFLGMLLSVPIAAVIRAIAMDYLDEYAQKKKKSEKKEID